MAACRSLSCWSSSSLPDVRVRQPGGLGKSNYYDFPLNAASNSLNPNPGSQHATLPLTTSLQSKVPPHVSTIIPKPPIVEKLNALAASDDSPFHFPGHKKGAGAPDLLLKSLGSQVFKHDLPELPELDNLFAPSGVILESQNLASNVFGSERTFFIVNGSTGGVHAAIMATCGFPGSFLVLPRNAHQCAVAAMVLSGAQPHYVLPEYDSHWKVPLEINPRSVEIALEKELGLTRKETQDNLGMEQRKGLDLDVDGNAVDSGKKKVGAVLIVSPTYHGACSDVKEIASICHDFGVPLIVDEAHGAHFKFHEGLPLSALEQGADIVIQSTHKVLGSLTQSAMVHVQGELIDSAKLARCLQLLQSSSPSYLFLASLDAATWQMSGPEGRSLLENAISLAKDARKRLNIIPGLELMTYENQVFESARCSSSISGEGVVDWDPLRVTVGTPGIPLTGYKVDDILRLEFRVVAELPSLNALTFAFSFGTRQCDVDRLVGAYEQLCDRYSSSASESCVPVMYPSFSLPPVPSSAMSPREAFFTDWERVSLADSVGRLCAELLCPYPPGVPVLIPGEAVTSQAIAHLRAVLDAGGSVSGAEDPDLQTVAVLKQKAQ